MRSRSFGTLMSSVAEDTSAPLETASVARSRLFYKQVQQQQMCHLFLKQKARGSLLNVSKPISILKGDRITSHKTETIKISSNDVFQSLSRGSNKKRIFRISNLLDEALPAWDTAESWTNSVVLLGNKRRSMDLQHLCFRLELVI